MRSFKVIPFLILFLLSSPIFGQSIPEVEMADVLRTNGKIYVVVAGLVIILTGIFIFLIRIERKLKKLEEHQKQINP